MKRSEYIDQWRGISVVMVVLNHLLIYRFAGTYAFAPGESLGAKLLFKATWFVELWGVHAGTVGVCVFFVISGYLITTLMLREELRTGTVSLRGFYIRRVFRIFPAMVVYVTVVAALIAGGAIAAEPHAALGALSFACNTAWIECRGPFTHFWSLAVEEQFYLFWPLLLLVSRGRWRFGIVVVTLVVAIAVAPLEALRVHGWLSNGLALSCLASGVLFALSARFRAAFTPFARLPAWLLVAFICGVLPFALTRWGAAQGATLRLLPLLLVGAVLAREGTISRSRLVRLALDSVGLASYSLYLWHVLATMPPGDYRGESIAALSWLALPIAWLSHRYVELPFVAIGRRIDALFEQRATNARQTKRVGLEPADAIRRPR